MVKQTFITVGSIKIVVYGTSGQMTLNVHFFEMFQDNENTHFSVFYFLC